MRNLASIRSNGYVRAVFSAALSGKDSTMKRLGIAIIALGAAVGVVHADNWAGYVNPQSSTSSSAHPVMQVCLWNSCGQPNHSARSQNNCGCASCGSLQNGAP